MQSPNEDPATQVMTRALALVHVTDDTVGIGGRKAGTGLGRLYLAVDCWLPPAPPELWGAALNPR